MLKKWIIGKKEPSDKDLFIWNLLGSGIYSGASMILTYLTIYYVGAELGGVFAIGLTLAQMFMYIVYYETRNYMVTDTADDFLFGDYHFVKVVNCIIMAIVCVSYVFFKRYDSYKKLIILLICAYRLLDAYADTYEGQFHKDGRLDLAGKSMAFRTVISVALYFIVLCITRNLMIALIVAVLSGMVGVIIFDFLVYDEIDNISWGYSNRNCICIWKNCFPLFLGMFLWTYLLSAPRIAVDNVLSDTFQSYFQVLFLPISVINLFAGFLIRPSLISLAELYANRKMKEFWKIIYKIFVCLFGITAVCMLGAYWIGIDILQILAGVKLYEYKMLFVFLIFAGGLNAFACLFYYVLTIFRNQFGILIGFIVASCVAFTISDYLTKRWQLWGAAWSYMISVIVLFGIFLLFIIKAYFVDNKNE